MGDHFLGKIEFENYGKMAMMGVNVTELSGRYKTQNFSEKNIVPDILRKMSIRPEDRVLEIGCGPGQIAIPLSFMVDELTGIDHPNVCNVLENRFKSKNLKLIPGNFLELDLKGKKYSKIICYSVITILAKSELSDFLDKALSHLESGGQMLVGDIANVDKKARFQNSDYGQEFEKVWHRQNPSASSEIPKELEVDPDRVTFTDEVLTDTILSIRKKGFHCYVLPQPDNLSWGHTREDLLVVRPK